REIMEKYGDVNKPIWFNEYGWNAAPKSFPEEKLIWKRVDEELQAYYTLQGIELARAEWPWAGVFNIWYFRQVGDISPDRADYYFRMVDVDFTPRRIYYAVKDAAAALTEAGPGHHEETSPAVSVGEGWQAVIEPQASAQACLVNNAPGASLTFTFRGDAVDLITRQDERAGRLYVTLDGHVVNGLDKEEGRSYVDLHSPVTHWQVKVPLVRRAGNGQHVLRLTVEEAQNAASSGSHCLIDAFDVIVAPPPSFPYLPVLPLMVGALGLGWLLYRELRARRRIRRS
ncbi:MAG: hypothetical protein ACETWB_03170, partial [Anaerolineae bacterium]